MRVVLLGAPGSGKGTQAALLAQKLNIPHISTGEIFRNNIRNNTELGIKAKEFIDKGLLVPDEITIGIIKERLCEKDCSNGFILDGFPRTVNQANYLEDTMMNMGIELDYALNIDVFDEEIIKRMSGRRVCSNCGSSYHIIYIPSKIDGRCDNCNSDLIQREDDKEETVLNRLKTYHIQTEPLVEYYREKGKLATAIGKNKVEETSNEVIKALGIV